MKIWDQNFNGIEKALDLRFKRHALLVSNVVNSETPGYKARELDFAGELSKAFGEPKAELSKTDAKHLDITATEGEHIVIDNRGALGADGNNVDLDMMMGRVSANGKAYETAANMLSQKFRMLRLFTRKGGSF
jgi:flagellar basal-body rod protein FlgB